MRETGVRMKCSDLPSPINVCAVLCSPGKTVCVSQRTRGPRHDAGASSVRLKSFLALVTAMNAPACSAGGSRRVRCSVTSSLCCCLAREPWHTARDPEITSDAVACKCISSVLTSSTWPLDFAEHTTLIAGDVMSNEHRGVVHVYPDKKLVRNRAMVHGGASCIS